MIAEYEIPKGTKLYFGETAKKKREIEASCANAFYNNGFEEISSPFFSYHQERADYRELIRHSDEKNHLLALRADSSLEVVRIIEKRLGRTTDHQKWFYIQPVFTYPTVETNQIGAEWIGCQDLDVMANIAYDMLKELNIEGTMQIGNIQIPKLVAKHLNLPIDVMAKHELEKLEALNIDWLNSLINATVPADLENICSSVPEDIKEEITRLVEIYDEIDCATKTISPLYYTKLEYYDNLFFRFINGVDKHAMGGVYTIESGVKAAGFAIYTDTLI